MTYEERKEIRKEVKALGWAETLKMMTETLSHIKEVAATMNVIEGLDGMKRQIKKNIDVERACYRLELCAKKLQEISKFEQNKWAMNFINEVFEA